MLTVVKWEQFGLEQCHYCFLQPSAVLHVVSADLVWWLSLLS